MALCQNKWKGLPPSSQLHSVDTVVLGAHDITCHHTMQAEAEPLSDPCGKRGGNFRQAVGGWRQVGEGRAPEVSFLLGKERRPEETGSKEMTRGEVLRGGQ